MQTMTEIWKENPRRKKERPEKVKDKKREKMKEYSRKEREEIRNVLAHS